ncbi:hypothetical protein OsI_37898 [Oryza sativa Indica Group]|uniref:Uncharacterized protein n=1 Tax=Oryza sativa subsp. indica TaxID=39946 RepID=A2ZJ98_ORYSI|nr:hypothetical protein OsI_37898 [Oryza sativa Indica Group]
MAVEGSDTKLCGGGGVRGVAGHDVEVAVEYRHHGSSGESSGQGQHQQPAARNNAVASTKDIGLCMTWFLLRYTPSAVWHTAKTCR